MIVVQNHIPVKDEYREQFEDLLTHRESLLSDFNGFIRNDVLKPVMGDNYVIMSFWESMEDFNAWTESEEFRKAHSNSLPHEAFSGQNFVTVHEVIHTVLR